MKQVTWTLIALLILFPILALVLIYTGAYNISAADGHSDFEHWLLETTMENSVEARAGNPLVPDLASPDLVRRGFVHYDAMCVGCHGAPGVPRAESAQGMTPDPPELTHAAEELDPAELYWIIDNGLKFTGMPAFGKSHSPDDLWSIVAFVRHLPSLGLYDYLNLRTSLPPPDSTSAHDTTPHAH